nr:unnamed protein product [Callosobruchus analis]
MLETRILFHVTLLFLLNLRSTKGDCYTRWPSCGNEENIVCTTNYGQTVANCEIIYNDPEISAPCFATTNFSEVGQNLNGRVFHRGENDTFHSPDETRKMVAEWYEYEITESNANVFEDFSRMKTMLIGYLYQMLWAESYRIGCGRSVSEKKYHMMICNYGPRGLRVTRPLGKIGRPCTKCPEEMSCNAEYEGLCGDIDESHYYITVDGAVSTFCSGAYIWLTMICFVGFAVSM